MFGNVKESMDRLMEDGELTELNEALEEQVEALKSQLRNATDVTPHPPSFRSVRSIGPTDRRLPSRIGRIYRRSRSCPNGLKISVNTASSSVRFRQDARSGAYDNRSPWSRLRSDGSGTLRPLSA
eukprot:4960537-Pyramimonas_sp.AAC.1